MPSSGGGAVRLRRVTPADLAGLAAFLPTLLSGDWSETALHRLLQSDHLLHVLTMRVDAAEVPVGFSECQQIVDEGHLLNVAIATHWQGRGLGKLLLEGVLAELASRGCLKCLLELRRSNTPALRLYQRAGFTLDGVRKAYYPPPDSGAARAAAGQRSPEPGIEASQREDALLYSLSLLPS